MKHEKKRPFYICHYRLMLYINLTKNERNIWHFHIRRQNNLVTIIKGTVEASLSINKRKSRNMGWQSKEACRSRICENSIFYGTYTKI